MKLYVKRREILFLQLMCLYEKGWEKSKMQEAREAET